MKRNTGRVFFRRRQIHRLAEDCHYVYADATAKEAKRPGGNTKLPEEHPFSGRDVRTREYQEAPGWRVPVRALILGFALYYIGRLLIG